MPKNFPFYQQHDEMDCGATCLRMVARYYGRYYSLESLRELTYMGKEGVSMLGISDAAELIGLHTFAAKVSFDQLKNEVPLPAIAHWKDNHFVVVYKVTAQHVWVADPGAGKFKFTKEEFLKHWLNGSREVSDLGTLLMLETTPSFFERDGERVDKSSFSYVLSYVRKYRSLISQIILGFVLGSVIHLVLPFLMKSIVDVGINNADHNFIYLAVISLLILYLSQAAVEYFRGWIVLHVGARVNISLISDFLIKLTKLPIKFFDSRMTGDLLQRISDHASVQRFLTSTSLISIFSLFNFVIFSIILFIWSPQVLTYFMLGTLIQVAWVYFFSQRRREVDYNRFDQASEIQSNLIELIDGMQEIKLHNAEKQKRWAWERIQSRLFRTEMKALRLNQLQRSGAQLINEAKNLIIIYIVATNVVDGEMSLGMLVAIQYIIGQLNNPLNQFAEFNRALQDAKISLERMDEIHTKQDEEKPEEKITILPEYGHLQLDRVGFKYPGPYSNMVLKEVTFQIPKGKTTAIVGTSGSGKTTILKLLLNFYQPTEGFIRLGDVSLNNIQSKLWRSKCGWVNQDGYIFNDTIAKNIGLGDEIIDKKRLLQAVKIANIQNFIESLPLGYNTRVGKEGLGLSQGQKQRLLIARMIYKQPDYIFLDEATTSLDSYSEMLILENLEEHFNQSTIVHVTHRISTVMNADHIIVMDSGEVVEQGTHKVLFASKGAYYHLLKNQIDFSI